MSMMQMLLGATGATGDPPEFTFAGYRNITSGDHTDISSWSVTIDDVPTVVTSGKRLWIAASTCKAIDTDASLPFLRTNVDTWLNTTYNDYEFTGGGATFDGTTLGATVVGQSKYNFVSLIYGYNDLNTTGSDADLTFTCTLRQSNGVETNADNLGYWALALVVLDNVSSYSIETARIDNSSGASMSNTANLNLSNSNGKTSALRFVAGVTSNSAVGNIYEPDWDKGASEPTYTSIGSGDNGSDECNRANYAWEEDESSPVNITGEWSTSAGSASDGIGGAAALVTVS